MVESQSQHDIIETEQTDELVDCEVLGLGYVAPPVVTPREVIKPKAQEWDRETFVSKTEESMMNYLRLLKYDKIEIPLYSLDYVAWKTVERLHSQGRVKIKTVSRTDRNGSVRKIEVVSA